MLCYVVSVASVPLGVAPDAVRTDRPFFSSFVRVEGIVKTTITRNAIPMRTLKPENKTVVSLDLERRPCEIETRKSILLKHIKEVGYPQFLA